MSQRRPARWLNGQGSWRERVKKEIPPRIADFSCVCIRPTSGSFARETREDATFVATPFLAVYIFKELGGRVLCFP